MPLKNKKMTNEYYEKLIAFQKNYPKLTFDNQGYKYLSKEVQIEFEDQIKEISNILKKTIKGFSQFNNFKPRKNGTFDIRVQYGWSSNFTGVGYFNIEKFKDFTEEE